MKLGEGKQRPTDDGLATVVENSSKQDGGSSERRPGNVTAEGCETVKVGKRKCPHVGKNRETPDGQAVERTGWK